MSGKVGSITRAKGNRSTTIGEYGITHSCHPRDLLIEDL